MSRKKICNIAKKYNVKYTLADIKGMQITGVESDLIVPVEAELIRRFRPLWNYAVDGFGNHDPGRGRYNQAKSEWDILHPGRTWAERLRGESPHLEDVIAKVHQA